MKKLPTSTMSNAQTLFVKNLVKQGYAYQTAKDFVLSSHIVESDMKNSSLWPSSGDLVILQSSSSQFQVRRLTPGSSLLVSSESSQHDAISKAREALQSNTASILKVTPNGFGLIYSARLKIHNTPIQVSNYNEILSSAFNPGSATVLNRINPTFMDIVISSTDKGFEVARLNNRLQQEVHSIHEQYPDALGQAMAIVQNSSIWLSSGSRFKLLLSGKPSGRYAANTETRVRKEPADYLFHDWYNQYRHGEIKPIDMKYKIVDEYMKNGYSASEALKEALRIMEWWDKRIEKARYSGEVDTGMYGISDWMERVKHNPQYRAIDDSDVTPDVGTLREFDLDKGEVTEKPKKEVTSATKTVKVFYIQSSAPVQKGSVFSMETVNLPELSEEPIVLFILPDISVPSLFKECEKDENKFIDDEHCLNCPQMLYGYDDSEKNFDEVVFLSASKDIPEDAVIKSSLIRFNPACTSRLSKILTSATSFKGL